ncbi:MAG: hypothetical protein ABS69_00695 [Nitrosomonadales bacterium SCN 54-20]|nr:MAG: hypothetical protein ABS69_00695 [Nitrosomonadales bacterium SCN 54-20]
MDASNQGTGFGYIPSCYSHPGHFILAKARIHRFVAGQIAIVHQDLVRKSGCRYRNDCIISLQGRSYSVIPGCSIIDMAPGMIIFNFI